ncbi:hypothetical protein BIW11_04615 [Tropilaelaps mercedesae]|uniref:Uncharacterized protein n=1 Tax=Tropilaelaps mercedesae TaxID=418985 RepID=A0A1V9X4G1_9ACAR|nr:hypothetical protein BIW11_04615 [Tropilaelaps mercedesae]
MANRCSDRSYDSDNSEVEQPPPPGGYQWSDDEVEEEGLGVEHHCHILQEIQMQNRRRPLT